jgi:hypothetical protein
MGSINDEIRNPNDERMSNDEWAHSYRVVSYSFKRVGSGEGKNMASDLKHLVVVLTLSFLFASVALARPRVIEMKDQEGEPYKEAARVLLRAMAKGDLEACKAAFVGEGDELKVLELMVKSNTAAAGLRDAWIAKFGDPKGFIKRAFTFADRELRGIDVQTIVVDSNRPDEASISPGDYGYELKTRDGKWMVRSMTGFPEDIPRLIVNLPQYTAGCERLKKKIESGEITKEDEAWKEMQKIEALRESVSRQKGRN